EGPQIAPMLALAFWLTGRHWRRHQSMSPSPWLLRLQFASQFLQSLALQKLFRIKYNGQLFREWPLSVCKKRLITKRYFVEIFIQQNSRVGKSPFFVSSTTFGSSMPRTSSAKIVFPAAKTRRVAKGCAVLKSSIARSAAILTRCKEMPRSKKLLTTR